MDETEDWLKMMLRRRYPCIVAVSGSGQLVAYCALAVLLIFVLSDTSF